jgi:hypothetical protein
LRVEHKVPEPMRRCTACGRTGLEPMGDGKHSFVWEFVPAKFVRLEHIQEVLRVQDHHANAIDELLPAAWAAAN